MAPADLAELWREFSALDCDGNGTVLVSEVRKWLTAEGRASEADALVGSIDTDGDGVMSFEEYLQLLNSQQQYTFSSDSDDDDSDSDEDC